MICKGKCDETGADIRVGHKLLAAIGAIEVFGGFNGLVANQIGCVKQRLNESHLLIDRIRRDEKIGQKEAKQLLADLQLITSLLNVRASLLKALIPVTFQTIKSALGDDDLVDASGAVDGAKGALKAAKAHKASVAAQREFEACAHVLASKQEEDETLNFGMGLEEALFGLGFPGFLRDPSGSMDSPLSPERRAEIDAVLRKRQNERPSGGRRSRRKKSDRRDAHPMS